MPSTARASMERKLLTEDTFYIVDRDQDLEGVDVATNATTQASAFTRYTVAPTTAFSQSTRMTGCVPSSLYPHLSISP